MKKITKKVIVDRVSALCIEANIHLRGDVRSALKKALEKETNGRAREILKQLLDNAAIAKRQRIAICQDTGLPVVFVEIGRGIDISGLDMTSAINKGIREGYKKGYLRNSIVLEPLLRTGIPRFSPGSIHYRFGAHQGLKITVLPKGFGCENKTRLKMFNPTASPLEIKDFIIATIKDAGPDACPPYVIGIGIGGSADSVCLLAKESLLIPLNRKNQAAPIARLESELLKKANQLDLGPMGLGGRATVLALHVKTAPTHIAGLPVCVNISCHALRSASATIR